MQVLVIVFMSVACIVALLYCFLGSRFFRAIFTFTAFLAGLAVAYLLAGVYFTTIFAKIAITLTGGIIAAIVFNQLQFAGRFLAGIFAGFAVGILFSLLLNISYAPYFWDAVLVLCLVLGITAAVNKSMILRASTAVFGAFLTAVVVFFLIGRGVSAADFKDMQSAKDAFNAVLGQYRYMILGCTALLALTGAFLQFFLALGVRPKKDLPILMYMTPPLLEDPAAKQQPPDTGHYIGRHLKLD